MRPSDPVPSPVAAATPLLDAFLDLTATLPAGQRRVAARLRWLAVGWTLTLGRRTITRALAALGRTEADWTAWHRLFSQGRFREEAAAAAVLAETLVHVPPAGPVVAAVDATVLRRSSRRMPGASWWPAAGAPHFARGLAAGQRFVGIHALLPRSAAGFGRAVPLRLLSAFPASATPAQEPPRREWEAARDAIAWLRGALDAAGRAAQPLVVVGDGAYDTAALLRSLPERTALLVRVAGNRALYALPEPEPPRRGGRRRYGARLPTPAEPNGDPAGWTRLELAIRGRRRRLSARLEGPLLVKPAAGRPCFLVSVRGVGHGAPKRRRRPWHGLVTAVPDGAGGWMPPADLATLVGWVWQRWEVELAHRELKTGLGLGESPAWSAAGTVALAQWVAWLYAVLALAGLRAWGEGPAPRARTARWWRGGGRWTLAQLLQGLRAEAAQTAEFRPACTATPPKPGGLPPPEVLVNALLAAART